MAEKKTSKTRRKRKTERLEKARILSRKAKIRELEKNIKNGLNKIPPEEKKKLELDEKRKKS